MVATSEAIDEAEVPAFDWNRSGYRLVSLWDMVQFDAGQLSNCLMVLATTQDAFRNCSDYHSIVSVDAVFGFKRILAYCDTAGFRMTAIPIQRIIDMQAKGVLTYAMLEQLSSNALERMRDEAQLFKLLRISPDNETLYEQSRDKWGDVPDKFPSAIGDIEESSKCLALERATASVFHLMRVMEHGLKAVARELGIPYAPSWESYLNQMDKQLRLKWDDKDPEWKRVEPFFRDVAANLYTVKVAWRNTTMHIVRSYTPEEAGEVYSSVRAFMRHLANHIAE